MKDAADALLALGAEGLQLTPGNAPCEGFLDDLRVRGVPVRTHHGFDARALRRQVWGPGAECQVDADSVHPPRDVDPASAHWVRRAESGDFHALTLETMYPGYALGTGDALTWAMDLGLKLAVDVAHLHIQREAGVLPGHVWRRLQDYPSIHEVHVSANPGDRDAHHPLRPDTFGLEWARARRADGTPLILECYMHRLSDETRRTQVALCQGTT
ncbi:hypothetical protein NVS55_12755 [Myxococcus stipitatus]|uniref:hypothetical protein n=1 Tax=Myxococcus stipitatus TaxID=83455 RepID=UPI0031452C78